jgi:hypothetical protein
MWKTAALTCLLASGAAHAACPVLDSRDWSADLVPAESGYTLVLRGTVDLPTPGYQLTWAPGPMDRALPPGWRLSLSATPPEGIVTQVVTPTRLEARFDTFEPRLRVLYIGCNEEPLTVLYDIAADPD